jgi:DNA-binding GntR family transcriptional regulator
VLATTLEPGAGVPLHRQLETTLRGLIQSGEVRPGSSLPGELELAAQLGVSRHTIRHALGVLTAEGLLRRERGRGTVVLPGGGATHTPFERSLSTFYAFAWEVRARGEEQRSFVLEREVQPAGPELAERLGVPATESLERIVRLRTANNDPLLLETSFLPRRLSEQLDQAALERDSVYDVLERRCGLRVVGARETIRPAVLGRPVARLLGVRAGSPVFRVERTTWTDAGPIEWQESIVRGDRFLYSVELPRRAEEAIPEMPA